MNEVFEGRYATDGECWAWTEYRNVKGYGVFSTWKRKFGSELVHRVSYMLHVGPIPRGITVDHLCFNRACVRPDHLQLLSQQENASRQRKALATHCNRGHEFTPENTYAYTWPGKRGKRQCRTCTITRRRVAA